MTWNQILFGLAAWTVLSLPIGLAIGAVMNYGAAGDDSAPMVALPTLRKIA
jgi:hypothetical protein